MEKLTYDEVRSWFWTRTWIWFVPASAASVAVHYMLPDMLPGELLAKAAVLPPATQTWVAVASGIATVLIGIFAAKITVQLPWMRAGWRFAFILNAPVSAVIAGIIAALLGLTAVTALDSLIPSAAVTTAPESVERVWNEVINPAKALTWFGTGVSIFWGLVFGCWFAIRRDRYFVDGF